MQVLNEPGEAYFNFINSINSDVTRKNYEYCMSRFLKYCNLDLNSLLKLPQQELSNLIIKYLVSLKISSQYKHVIVASIKHACEMNDVILNWKKLKKFIKSEKTDNESIPELWAPLEFALSIKTVLNIKNCTLPFAGILLGPPSSLKTVIVEFFRKWKNSYYTDGFTARTFVSHYAGIKEEQLKKIDMLPKIKDKFFLCSELSTTFMKKEDELNEIISILTRILDGQGLTTDSGACGQRSYEGEYMFNWLGAAVDIPYRAHKLMGSVGPKLYFFRPSLKKKDVVGSDTLLPVTHCCYYQGCCPKI